MDKDSYFDPAEEKLIKEYTEAIRRLRNSGVNLVDKSEWQYRLGVCKTCEHWEQYGKTEEVSRCLKCGCPSFTFMERNKRCPLVKPKWR